MRVSIDEMVVGTIGQLARGLSGDEAVEGVHEHVGAQLPVGVKVRNACS